MDVGQLGFTEYSFKGVRPSVGNTLEKLLMFSSSSLHFTASFDGKESLLRRELFLFLELRKVGGSERKGGWLYVFSDGWRCRLW